MVGRLLSAMRDEVPASLGGRGVLIASCRNPGFNSLASVPRALMAEAYEASAKAFIDQVDECASWAHVVPGADKPWQGVMSDSARRRRRVTFTSRSTTPMSSPLVTFTARSSPS